MIISCHNSADLSTKIATFCNMELLFPAIKIFTASEMIVELPVECVNKEIYIIQSLSYSSNNQIMELLLTINAAKNSGAKKIHLILPYIAYSRQDRKNKNTSTAMEVIANILNNSGISSIITIDIHNKNSIKLFDIPVINIETASFFLKNKESKLIVMPDSGCKNRNNINHNFISLEKIRNNNDISFRISDNIEEKDCIIIDDIIDSGKTLCLAAEFLLNLGAKSVEGYVTHALFSKESSSKIDNSNLSKLTISNSIEQKFSPKNLNIMDISKLICHYMNKAL